MPENTHYQAVAYPRHANVRVLNVLGAIGVDSVLRPYEVIAHVAGLRDTYIVSFDQANGWVCNCPAGATGCPHVLAVQLATRPTPETATAPGDPAPKAAEQAHINP